MNTTAGHMITAATHDYLGICDTCVRPTRQTVADADADATFTTITCPQCGAAVQGERIHATVSQSLCNVDCMGAVGPSCSCACGGANHAGAFTAVEGEMLETALAKYRARLAAKQAKVDARHRAKVTAFEEWAADNRDVVAYLDTSDAWSDMIRDFQNMVADHKPLSDRQAAVVRKCIARKAEADARRARLDAAPRTTPELGQQVIEGEILSYNQKTGFRGKLEHKLTIECGGFRVYMNMPRSIAPTTYTAIEWQEFTRALRGRRIRTTVTLAPTFRNDDPSFVLGKAPSKTTLL